MNLEHALDLAVGDHLNGLCEQLDRIGARLDVTDAQILSTLRRTGLHEVAAVYEDWIKEDHG